MVIVNSSQGKNNPRARFEAVLHKLGINQGEYAHCPFHPDSKRPSLSVDPGRQGTIYFCFNCKRPHADFVEWERHHVDGAVELQTYRARGYKEPEDEEAPLELARTLWGRAVKTKKTDCYLWSPLAERCFDEVPKEALFISKADLRSVGAHRGGFDGMLFLVVKPDAEGKLLFTGVTVTLLNRDHRGYAKNRFGTVRRSFGPIGGGFVVLGQPDPDSPLLIAEGIETALTAHVATGYPAIATLGVAGMARCQPPPGSEYIILCDNDWPGKAAAQALATTLLPKVRIAYASEPHNDWNDERMAGATWRALDKAINSAPKLDPAAFDGAAAKVALKQAIADLAKLDPAAAALERKAIKERFGISLKDIDTALKARAGDDTPGKQRPYKTELVPAEDPVRNPDRLLDTLYNIFDDHIVFANMPEACLTACVLWVVHTYAHDYADHSPVLFVTSPTKGCGKSTVLKVLNRLVAKPLSSANMTGPTAFRLTEKYKPTLLLDEFDNTNLAERKDYLAMMNSGHSKDGAFVHRCVGDDIEPTEFATWAPKAVAAIGRVASTVEDRSITIPMSKKFGRTFRKPVPKDIDCFDTHRRRIMRWVKDNAQTLTEAEPKTPEELGDRQADNWRALLAVADLAGSDWPKLARDAARALSAVNDDETHAIVLLRDLRDLFAGMKEPDISSAAIVNELQEMEDRPWPDYKRGQPIAVHHVAALLRPFGIYPGKIGPRQKRRNGYRLSQFESAFKRYLPPLKS